jgi:hypothetical protein
MNPNVWKLHADVFDLARARGVGAFRVDYKAHAAGVVIELVMESARAANRERSAPSPVRDEAPLPFRSQAAAEHGA